ncbi:MAG: beta-ketoacyl synthase [Pseudohongiellaceae bacterium]
MSRLPIIVGFGGVNAAGRSSHHHGYRRIVFDALGTDAQNSTLASLAVLCGSKVNSASELTSQAPQLLESTLIRELEDTLFQPAEIPLHAKAVLNGATSDQLEFKIQTKKLPTPLPNNWEVCSESNGNSTVRVSGDLDVLLPATRKSDVNSAGQLPKGFDPSDLYASRNHPRGLQLSIFAASDALNSLGIDWDEIRQKVPADQISVYAGSGLGQMDYHGNGGLLQARLLGKKVSSKQLALGYAEMPADFINAYVLGNLGTTGTSVAACATFLYNLRQGLKDIQSGASRVVVVGTSEAPLTPEVFEGFATMGALADDESLRKLDRLQRHESIDFRKACRPFGNNVGFTLAESAQVIVLFDDELTMELGATAYGAVNEVFINADGFKKSIASPGLGNYISMAKAAAATQNIIGADGLKHRSYVHSHGTGTPQNRQTESLVLDDTAKRFGISRWPVTAVKSFIGHSLASSAGDQIMATLGFWNEGILPGILSVDQIADDVATSQLDFQLAHSPLGKEAMDATLINSKGFGGNNASASILAPHIVSEMLMKRYGEKAFTEYQRRNEKTTAAARAIEEKTMRGENLTTYKFDHNVLAGENLSDKESKLFVDGIEVPVSLDVNNPYSDMCE